MHSNEIESLSRLVRLRWRMAITLSAVMVSIYFGFILLVAFNKEMLAVLIIPGLTVGIALGALVIVLTWAVTWFYVRWANKHIDGEIERLDKVRRERAS